jgi:hypothetical protein
MTAKIRISFPEKRALAALFSSEISRWAPPDTAVVDRDHYIHYVCVLPAQ